LSLGDILPETLRKGSSKVEKRKEQKEKIFYQKERERDILTSLRGGI